MKIYLFTCEFCIGEYEQIFYKAFRAKSTIIAIKESEKYFRSYYGPKNCFKIDNDGFGTYSYFDSQIIINITNYNSYNTILQFGRAILENII